MKKEQQIWKGIGCFPPGGWEESPYRFLDQRLNDGTKIECDFWREVCQITLPEKKNAYTFGASLEGQKDRKDLLVTVWLPKKIVLDDSLYVTITKSLKAALMANGYIADIKSE